MGGPAKMRLFGWMLHLWLFVSLTASLDSKPTIKGNNLCTRIDWYEKDVIVPKTKRIKVTLKKWCVAIPPSCTYDEWKTVFENETVKVNHTRTVYQCCPGYKNHYGACVPVCHLGCGHGECVEPDVCSCNEGWKGPLCIHECEENRYGKGCMDNCSCLHGATCDKKDGSCHCSPGFMGEFCEYTCPYNMYGVNCAHQCKCQNDAFCDIVDGSCECEPGFTGEYCQLRCDTGNHGKNCEGECVCLPESTVSCDPVTGECICKPGSTGIYCERQCDNFTYGRHCSQACDCSRLNTEFCEPADGSCVCKTGWTGDKCSEKCPAGKFGEHCEFQCAPCPNSSATCNLETGFCDCPPGSFGEMCLKSCPSVRWGSNCTEECNCPGDGFCNPVTGKCICKEDQSGVNCLQITEKINLEHFDCKPPYYGDNCSLLCNCSEAEACDHNTGECLENIRDFLANTTDNKLAVALPIFFVLLFGALVTFTVIAEVKGCTSIRDQVKRSIHGPRGGTTSTDNIVGEGMSNPVYGCHDDAERDVAISLEGPNFQGFDSVSYQRGSEFPVELVRQTLPDIEQSNNTDSEADNNLNEIDGNRSSFLNSIKSIWSAKNAKEENQDFLSAALNDICTAGENIYETVPKKSSGTTDQNTASD